MSRGRDGVAARRGALVATTLGFAVVQLDVSVVNVAIKPIGADLGGGVDALQWVVNGYTITFAALILSAGALGDRVGAKRVLIGGFALFTLASVACGAAPTLGVLVAARVVQGIGAAALVPASLSVLNHANPDAADRSRAVGVWAAGASVALAGGPLVGGALTAAFGWRSVFLVNLPLGVVGIAVTARCASETSRSADRRADPPGQLLAIGALALLAGGVIEGGRLGFANPLVLGGLLTAVLLGAAFVVVEGRRRNPMLPLELFRSATFSAATAIGFAINIGFYGLVFVLSLFFQTGQHLSALATGLAFAPMTGILLVSNLAAGPLAGRFGSRAVVVAGAVLEAVGLALLLPAAERTPYLLLAGPLLALGAGLGLIVPAVTAAQLGAVDASRSGIAAGTLNTARQAGSVVGVALFGAFTAEGRALGSGLHLGLAVSLGLAVVVGVLALRLPGRDAH